MKIPVTMHAVVLTGHGGLDKLEFRTDWPVPQPANNEVLIRVGACGMNNTDINTRTAWYSTSVKEGTHAEGGMQGFDDIRPDAASWGRVELQFPRIQGADVCGQVVAVGDEGAKDLVGKRVLIDPWLRDWDDPENLELSGYYGSECNGGYAQYTTAPATNIHPISSDWSDSELATFATAYITAEHMLVRANVARDDVVLIPGASGGVGSALIQLTKRRGAIPVAMCAADKAEQVMQLGARAVIGRSPPDLGAELQEKIHQSQVDVVADVVGGSIWPQLISALKRGGRYTCAGAIAGPVVEFDLRTFYLNNHTFTGATVVPAGLFANLVGYIERKEIQPILAETWALEDLRDAQEAFLRKKHIGNMVITV